LDKEDEESCGKKKKVLKTPVSIIYIFAPKQSSQETDAQKTKKRKAENNLQEWGFLYKKTKENQSLGNPMELVKIALDELPKRFEKTDEESLKKGVEETIYSNVEEKPKNEEGKLTKKKDEGNSKNDLRKENQKQKTKKKNKEKSRDKRNKTHQGLRKNLLLVKCSLKTNLMNL